MDLLEEALLQLSQVVAIFFFFFLPLCWIPDGYAASASPKDVLFIYLFIFKWNQGAAPDLLGSANQMPLREMGLRLCVTFELSGAWLSANAASNGESESGGPIDLPVTFTRLA